MSSAARETFVDETTSKQVVSKTFIGVGIVLLAMAFTVLFIWTYQKSYKLFIMVFSIIVFIFSLITVVFVTMTRAKLTDMQFRIYLSGTVFMTLMSLAMFIIFTIFAVGHLKRIREEAAALAASGRGSASQMVPPQLDTYASNPYETTIRQSGIA